MKEILKLIIILLIAFFVTYCFLFLFLYCIKRGEQIDQEILLMPSIVMSAAFIALLNLRETSKNNRETVEWKEKERTISLHTDYEKIVDTFNMFFDDDYMHDFWGADALNDYNEAVGYVRSVRSIHQREDTEKYQKIANDLRVASNLYEHMAIQYNHDLLNKKMFKKMYSYPLKNSIYFEMSIFDGYLEGANHDELIALLEDWNLDYKKFPEKYQSLLKKD